MARILVIDDDPDIQQMMGLTLNREGYEVYYAFTGKEGYERILSLNPDMVILDMMLPLLNGVQVLKLMRAEKTSRNIPVIVLTGYHEDPAFVETSVKPLGIIEYMHKPVKMDDLLRILRMLLSNLQQRTPLSFRLRKGVVRIEPKYRTVWIDDHLTATLPLKRFEVLTSLIQNKGEVSRSELLKAVWNSGITENTLEKTVQRLREDFGAEATRIRTTPTGYELIG